MERERGGTREGQQLRGFFGGTVHGTGGTSLLLSE